MTKSWVYETAIDVPLKGNMPLMLKWITGAYGYTLHSISQGRHCKLVKAKTVRNALKRGHLDMEVFAFANAVKLIPVPWKDKNGRVTWSNEIVAAAPPRNFVVDMDNVPGIKGKTKNQRIASLRARCFDQFGAFPSLFVTETSPYCFHLFYSAQEGDPEWTFERRVSLGLKLVGAKTKPRTEKELEAVLRAGGVDYGYLKQKMDLAKFRIPGSVNVKKSMNKTDSSIVQETVIVGAWINPTWRPATKADMAELDRLNPPVAVAKKKKTKDPWKRFMPEVCASLTGFVPFAILEKLAAYLCNDFNFLQKGCCRILQVRFAALLGISQPSASRLLKELKDWGFLIQVQDYEYNVKSKTYESGPLLRAAFERSLFKGRKYNFFEPYEDGNSKDHYLSDIRAAIDLGYTEEQTVAIIMEKQAMRAADRQRRPKDIARTYRVWLNQDQTWSRLKASG